MQTILWVENFGIDLVGARDLHNLFCTVNKETYIDHHPVNFSTRMITLDLSICESRALCTAFCIAKTRGLTSKGAYILGLHLSNQYF